MIKITSKYKFKLKWNKTEIKWNQTGNKSRKEQKQNYVELNYVWMNILIWLSYYDPKQLLLMVWLYNHLKISKKQENQFKKAKKWISFVLFLLYKCYLSGLFCQKHMRLLCFWDVILRCLVLFSYEFLPLLWLQLLIKNKSLWVNLKWVSKSIFLKFIFLKNCFVISSS